MAFSKEQAEAVNNAFDKVDKRINGLGVTLHRISIQVTERDDRTNDLHKRVSLLEERIATLEARLKTFEALERLGIASQLGEEMIARTDELVTTLEHEMQEKMDEMRAKQHRALEGMRTEMDQYRANMAKTAK